MKSAFLVIATFWLGFAGATQSAVILDVRTPAEYNEGHVKGARNLDFNSPEFKTEIAKMDKNAAYKVYCKKGGRADKSKAAMREMGFNNVESLGGVQDAAKKLSAPIETPFPRPTP